MVLTFKFIWKLMSCTYSDKFLYDFLKVYVQILKDSSPPPLYGCVPFLYSLLLSLILVSD